MSYVCIYIIPTLCFNSTLDRIYIHNECMCIGSAQSMEKQQQDNLKNTTATKFLGGEDLCQLIDLCSLCYCYFCRGAGAFGIDVSVFSCSQHFQNIGVGTIAKATKQPL